MDNIGSVERHYMRIFRESNQIKRDSQFLPTADYFHKLYVFYLRDIEDTAKKICDEIIDYYNVNSLKLTTKTLEEHIVRRLSKLKDNYERITNGYNMGGMRSEYTKFEEDKLNFKAEADELIERISRTLSRQYDDQ